MGTLPNIGLTGPMRSGKSTIAEYLERVYGYTVLHFADPVRALAWHINPVVDMLTSARYRDRLALYGYEYCKDTYPEFRRILQEIGAGARRVVYPDVWVDAFERQLIQTDGPVVVADVRYINEAERLRLLDFSVVHISRPGVAEGTHESERRLPTDPLDWLLYNDTAGTAELYGLVDQMLSDMDVEAQS